MENIKQAISEFKNASTLEEYEITTKKISALYLEITDSNDRKLIKREIKDKAHSMHESVKALNQRVLYTTKI